MDRDWLRVGRTMRRVSRWVSMPWCWMNLEREWRAEGRREGCWGDRRREQWIDYRTIEDRDVMSGSGTALIIFRQSTFSY